MKFKSYRMMLMIAVALITMLAFSQLSYALSFKKKGLRKAKKEHGYINPWSFQFAVDDKFSDDDNHGLRFSFLKSIDRTSAVRFNFGLTGHETEYNIREVYISNGSGMIYEADKDFDITGGYLSMQFLHYPNRNRGLNFFWGAGPIITLNEPDFEYAEIYEGDYYIEVDKDNSAYLGLGLEGTLGMEWFFGKHFSLLAEYGMTLQNRWLLYEVEYYDSWGDVYTEVDAISDGVSFDADLFRLGMAFHF